MKSILSFLFKKKKQPSKELFIQAEEMMKNHFKYKFGKDVKVSFQISEAEKDSEFLSEHTIYWSGNQHHFIHYKK